MPARRIIIFFLIIFFFLFVFTDFALAKCTNHDDCQYLKEEDEHKRTIKCIEGRCVRALEITYPKIPGIEVPETVASGLPDYVKYLFTLAVAIIGLVIFGVLIYNGVLYLTSAGRPEQMTEARKGILYAFLGGVLLLASGIIFNTINPQLKIMKLPEVDPLEQVVIPGVYICNHKVDNNIGKILKNYIEKKGEEQIKAAKELRKIMENPEFKRGCPRVNFSGNLPNFKVTKNETIFIVPSLVLTEEGRRAIYEYGIVLHEKENFGGQCHLVQTEAGENKIYGENGQSGQIKNYSAQYLKFTARSVTVFQKPFPEPREGSVELYECLNYNREGKCTENDPPLSKPFGLEGEGDLRRVRPVDLGGLKNNTRSITFSPLGSYFALLFEGGNFDKRCKLLRKNNLNLMDLPIGMCPAGCRIFGSWLVKRFTGSECAPCLSSMIVVKGSVL